MWNNEILGTLRRLGRQEWMRWETQSDSAFLIHAASPAELLKMAAEQKEQVDRLSYEDIHFIEKLLTIASGMPKPANVYINLYCWSRYLAQGRREYYPDARTCEALSQMEIRIPANVCRQPYESFAVCFDRSWAKSIAAPLNQPTPMLALMVHREDWQTMLMTIMLDMAGWAGVFRFNTATDNEVESTYLQRNDGSLDRDEEAVCRICERVALNAAMTLTHFPHQRVPTDKAAKHQAFMKHADLEVRERGARLSLNDRELLVIDQSVKLYQSVSEPNAPGGGTHASPVAHWRRGHWRLFDRENKRMTFIRPVMVNAGKFVGSDDQTKVTYRGAP